MDVEKARLSDKLKRASNCTLGRIRTPGLRYRNPNEPIGQCLAQQMLNQDRKPLFATTDPPLGQSWRVRHGLFLTGHLPPIPEYISRMSVGRRCTYCIVVSIDSCRIRWFTQMSRRRWRSQ